MGFPKSLPLVHQPFVGIYDKEKILEHIRDFNNEELAAWLVANGEFLEKEADKIRNEIEILYVEKAKDKERKEELNRRKARTGESNPRQTNKEKPLPEPTIEVSRERGARKSEKQRNEEFFPIRQVPSQTFTTTAETHIIVNQSLNMKHIQEK